VCSSDLD